MHNDPYRPTTQFSVFPPAIKNLLIINGLVFLGQMTPVLGPILMEFFALHSLRTPFFYPWQLVTYGFLHGDFMHILFNMFALWMFGTQVENTMGTKRFLTYYFVCVVGAGAVQMVAVYTSGSFAPTVGASGAVFGLLLAFGMFYPNQPIYLYFLFPIKAKWFVIIFGALELIYGVSNVQPGVANFAHLGGMVFGFFLIQYWRGRLPVQPNRTMYI